MWTKNKDWDEQIDEGDQIQWSEVDSDLQNLHMLSVQRCITVQDPSESVTYHLVSFCDASNRAYATAIKLVQETEEEKRSDLIYAKELLLCL